MRRTRPPRGWRVSSRVVLVSLCAVVALCGATLTPVADAGALVWATNPSDRSVLGSVFLWLFRPTRAFDETALGGFEFLISSRNGEFRANDQYLIVGEATTPAASLANDLGGVDDLSGVPFTFSIEHHLVGGRNFTFRLTRLDTQATSVLCWGQGCPPGSISAPLLDGLPPIRDYNALQVQVRAQRVAGSSAEVRIDSLSGVRVFGADLFDETVTPDVPGTLLPFDFGRRGQWLLGTNLDLVDNEWKLAGSVTLTRPDAALVDVTQVRLAVDLVRHTSLPFLPVPELSADLLLVVAGALLLALDLWRRCRPAA